MKNKQENKNVSEPRAKPQPLPKVTPRQRYVLERMREGATLIASFGCLKGVRLLRDGERETVSTNTYTGLLNRHLVRRRLGDSMCELTDLGRAVLEKQN